MRRLNSVTVGAGIARRSITTVRAFRASSRWTPASRVATPSTSLRGHSNLTAVLPVYESPSRFLRQDYECIDDSAVVDASEVKLSGRTLVVLTVHERWSCRYNGMTGLITDALPAGPLARDRVVAQLILVEPDGTLRWIAKDSRTDLLASDGAVRADAVGVLERSLLLAVAVPKTREKAIPGEDQVPLSCGDPGRVASGLLVEADIPASVEESKSDREPVAVTVPGGTSRLTLRVSAVYEGGKVGDVTQDPCLLLHLVDPGLIPAPVKGTFETSRRRVGSGRLHAYFRGRRLEMAILAGPRSPEVPEAAGALLRAEFPGFRLLNRADCPGWNFFFTGYLMARIDSISAPAANGSLLQHELIWAEMAFERMGEPALRVAVGARSLRWVRAIVVQRPDLALKAEQMLAQLVTSGRSVTPRAEIGGTPQAIESEAEMREVVARLERGKPGDGTGSWLVQRLESTASRRPRRDVLLALATPALANWIEKARGYEKDGAIRIVRAIGAPARGAVPVLERALRDPRCVTRVEARRALAAVRDQAPAVIDPGEEHRETAIRCDHPSEQPAGKPASSDGRRGGKTVPERMLVVRELRLQRRPAPEAPSCQFNTPIPIDWREFVQEKLSTFVIAPEERAALAAAVSASGEAADRDVEVTVPLPPALGKLSYLAVTATGVEPMTPVGLRLSLRRDEYGAGAPNLSGVMVGGRSSGFVVISDHPLTVPKLDEPSAVRRRWSKALAAEGWQEDSANSAAPYQFGVRGQGVTEDYLFIPLPGDPSNCSDRKLLARIRGDKLHNVARLEADCDV